MLSGLGRVSLDPAVGTANIINRVFISDSNTFPT